jgi:hypothetical protein
MLMYVLYAVPKSKFRENRVSARTEKFISEYTSRGHNWFDQNGWQMASLKDKFGGNDKFKTGLT